MSDDRQLLEDAARAAGIEVIRSRLDDPMNRDFLVLGSVRNPHQKSGPWNPLTDDGDGARLEAALGLAVEWDEYWVCVGGSLELYACHGGDKQAARRRAGVRAASALTQPEGGA